LKTSHTRNNDDILLSGRQRQIGTIAGLGHIAGLVASFTVKIRGGKDDFFGNKRKATQDKNYGAFALFITVLTSGHGNKENRQKVSKNAHCEKWA
jgi:hypothetical protein